MYVILTLTPVQKITIYDEEDYSTALSLSTECETRILRFDVEGNPMALGSSEAEPTAVIVVSDEDEDVWMQVDKSCSTAIIKEDMATDAVVMHDAQSHAGTETSVKSIATDMVSQANQASTATVEVSAFSCNAVPESLDAHCNAGPNTSSTGCDAIEQEFQEACTGTPTNVSVSTFTLLSLPS